MIEIDRSKCKKMLVWDYRSPMVENRSPMVERIVICFDGESYLCVNHSHEDKFKEGGNYGIVKWTNAKPLPEPKPMTALDAMWWAGTRKVYKYKHCTSNIIISFGIIDSGFNLNEMEWNELIRENGETKLKYEQWKPFNFDECDMGENK